MLQFKLEETMDDDHVYIRKAFIMLIRRTGQLAIVNITEGFLEGNMLHIKEFPTYRLYVREKQGRCWRLAHLSLADKQRDMDNVGGM